MEQAGVPVLMNVMADTGDGDTPPAIYHPPGNAEPVGLERVIISDQEFTDEFVPETGEVKRKERCKLTVIALVLLDAGIAGIQSDAQVEIAEERWHVDVAASKWGNVMVDLGLSRKPLVRKQEARRANV